FGGIHYDTSTIALADPAVWELRVDTTFTSGTWYKKAYVNADTTGQERLPLPRFGHSMVSDERLRFNRFAGKWGHVGFMYGGKIGASTYSDTLWKLWLFEDGSYGWQPRILGGSVHPGSRARLGLVLDPNQGGLDAFKNPAVRLYLFGGENASGMADSTVYALDPWDSTATWQSWATLGHKLAGMSMTLDPRQTFARTPEAYLPSTRSWQSRLSSSLLLEPEYPPTFAISTGNQDGNRVIAQGADNNMYYLDV